MKPITYSLQFRGQSTSLDDGLRKQGSAPSGALVTSVGAAGIDARYVWAPGGEEAFLDSTLAFRADGDFEEEGTIVLPGGTLLIRGYGRISASPDPDLRQGTVAWTIEAGTGWFEGASGLITSNFLLSRSGDLTDNQLGVIFTQALYAAS